MPKKLLLFLVKVAVTSFLLYFVFRDLSFAELASQLQDFSPLPLVLALGLIAGQGILVVAWRWAQILTSIDRPIAGQDLVAPTIIGLFFNQVLPSTVGGDGIRVWLLSRMDRSLGLALRSVLIDRLLGMLALMVMSGLGALAVMSVAKTTTPLWGAAAVSLAGATVILAAPLFLKLVRFVPFAAIQHQMKTVANEIRMLLEKGSLLPRLFLLSAVGHLLLASSICAIAAGLDIELPLLPALAILPAVFLAASLPVSVAGWGVREGAMVLGMGLIGVAAEPAALISVSYGLLQLGFGLLGGLVWLVYGRPKPAERLAN